MKLLVDTHVLLWALADPDQLSSRARVMISDSGNVVFVSMASLWEIGIKKSLGKIELPDTFFTSVKAAGFEILPIQLSHIQVLGELPFHHRDPFDRMLVAQAQHEQLWLVSCDAEINKYLPGMILWD